MSLLIAFVFMGLICTGYGGVEQSCDSAYSEQDYALHFPNKGITDYTTVTKDLPDLTEFTLCFWMKSTDEQPGSPFSYCTKTAVGGNELLIFDYRSLHLYINNEGSDSGVAANDGNWHHLCFSWTNSDGSYQLYKDGDVSYSQIGLQTGYKIKGNGTLTVGQEQDGPTGSDCGVGDSSQSVQGLITNLNLWSCVLPAETISKMYQTCIRGEGDVLKWTDFKHNIKGDAEVVVPSPCIP